LSHVCLNSIPASEALHIAEHVFREAATATRDHCFATEGQSFQVRLVQLSSIARAVWTGDKRFGFGVFQGCELGFKHLNVSGPRPVLVSPFEFEADFAEAKRSHLNSKQATNSGSKKAQSTSALFR